MKKIEAISFGFATKNHFQKKETAATHDLTKARHTHTTRPAILSPLVIFRFLITLFFPLGQK
jgi:hypothetical protein